MAKLRRNGWVALLALGVAYACGTDRNFATGDGSTGGGAGEGSANFGGSAGKSAGGGAGKSGATGGSSSGGQGGAGPGEDGGAGNVGASGGVGPGGQGGEGGDGIIVPPEPGRPGTAVVAGGHLMKSAHYSLVCTTGEGPGGNGVYSSPGYRLFGGVVGTTQP